MTVDTRANFFSLYKAGISNSPRKLIIVDNLDPTDGDVHSLPGDHYVKLAAFISTLDNDLNVLRQKYAVCKILVEQTSLYQQLILKETMRNAAVASYFFELSRQIYPGDPGLPLYTLRLSDEKYFAVLTAEAKEIRTKQQSTILDLAGSDANNFAIMLRFAVYKLADIPMN
jgi:hypothetical protein